MSPKPTNLAPNDLTTRQLCTVLLWSVFARRKVKSFARLISLGFSGQSAFWLAKRDRIKWPDCGDTKEHPATFRRWLVGAIDAEKKLLSASTSPNDHLQGRLYAYELTLTALDIYQPWEIKEEKIPSPSLN